MKGQLKTIAANPATAANPASGTEARQRINQDLNAFFDALLADRIFSDEGPEQIAFIKRLLTNGNASQQDLITALDALERVLQKTHPLLPYPLSFHQAAAKQSSQSNEPASTDFSPTDSQLLAVVSERFYQSWTFRFVGGMLIAAALFAVAGSVVIGNQTLNLREELRSLGDGAKKDIDNLQQTTRNALAEQARQIGVSNEVAKNDIQAREKEASQLISNEKEQIARQDKELATQSALLATKIKDADAEVDQRISTFKRDTEKQAIAEVVIAVQHDLTNQEKGIAAQILDPLQQIQQKDLTDIRTRLTTVGSAIDDVTKSAGESRRKLDAATPTFGDLEAALPRLKAARDEIDSIREQTRKQVDAITALLTETKNTQTSVNAVAKSVSDQSKGAVTDHDRITALLKRTEDESNTQIERIGRIEEQGDSLKVLVAKLTEDVKGREAEIARAPQVIADAKKMTDTAAGYAADLNKLQDQLADLKDGVKKAGDGLAATKHALDDATNASERLTPVRLRVLALQPVVDAIDNRAGALSVSLDGAAKDLVGITKSKQFLQETNLDLALLRVDIDRMTKARDELQRRLDSLQPPPEPNKPRSSDATPVDNTGNSGKSQAESPIDHLQFNDIINIQKALARKKLYLGRIDGIMGPGTSQAIGKYQQSINADQSGKITASQRDLLLNDRQS